MSAKPIELILLRQLARRLPLPVLLVDAEGTLVYFNPATERLLGFDQAELGEFPIARFGELFDPRDTDQTPIAVDRMPIAVALHDRCPQQGNLIVHGSDGVPHRIVTTAVPLDGQGGALLGAMSVFWEEEEGD